MGSNPPVIIPIGTSNPVDLSAGLPLFPGLGTARAGIAASARSYKLFDIPILIVCTRLKISAYAGYGFGMVGPAVAFLSKSVSVARQDIQNGDAGQVTLTFSDGPEMQAGAFVGAYVAGGVTAALQIYLPRPWWKVWAFTWQNVFTFNKDFQIDLLALMSKLIQYLLSKKPNAGTFKEDTKDKLKETNLEVKGFILEGSSSGVRRDLRATPEMTAPLNLANYVPKLREVNLALAKIDGEISFGPTAHLQFPVTFNFDGFTVVGGIRGASQADYWENVQYRNNQVTATGKTPFNLRENPTRFTTHVRYQTAVRVAISIHAKVKVAKFFSIEVNTPSLDLTYLLFRRPESIGPRPVENSVSTDVGGGCVLTPNMTLRFQGPDNPLEIKTGQLAKGLLTLAGFRSSSPATVALEIEPEPRASNFPNIIRIPAGFQFIEFPFTFQNQCLPTGDRSDPSEMVPPSPIAPLQTYRVRATLLEYQGIACSDYQAETPLNITNRFIRCQAFRQTPRGIASPPWDELASGRVNEEAGVTEVLAVLWFDYVSGEEPQTVPVTFTLLDENRQPYGRSDVEISTNGERGFLAPSCTLNVTLLGENQSASNLSIRWNSEGKSTGYSNLFYLVVNAGCRYGQTEFWLDVYNWS
jgi:hypothetical protein